MTVPLWAWLVTVGIVLALVAMDFLTVTRHPHEVRLGEAAGWSLFYIGVAVAFGLLVFWSGGTDMGTQYFTAYLVEKSLSVDNLFVFAIILARFRTPPELHQRVLLIGVVLALVFRTVFIIIGAAALAAFSVTFVVFGGLLIWTGVQLARHWDEDPEPTDNFAMRAVRRLIPVTEDYDGVKAFTRVSGRRLATPLLLVIVAIGSTDVLFALDSIPATFGVTQVAFLVFAANAFALLGLRALFFLIKGLLDRLVYLSLGLAVILIFIGIKLILAFAHGEWPAVPHVSTPVSLAVIVVVLAATTVASVIKARRDPEARAHAGVVLERRDPDSRKPPAGGSPGSAPGGSTD